VRRAARSWRCAQVLADDDLGLVEAALFERVDQQQGRDDVGDCLEAMKTFEGFVELLRPGDDARTQWGESH
jgi:hypothetical protein